MNEFSNDHLRYAESALPPAPEGNVENEGAQKEVQAAANEVLPDPGLPAAEPITAAAEEQHGEQSPGLNTPVVAVEAVADTEAVSLDSLSAAASEQTPPETTPAPSVPEPAAEEAKSPAPKSDKMDWYILKVQSNREESIREGLLRRVAIAGLDYYFGDVIVPTEKVTEFKGGKKKVVKRKLYPGYLVVQMELNDDTWFLVRETPGIGDFTGAAGRPSPMLPHEVARIIAKEEEKSEKAPKLKIAFHKGERVKIREGTFQNFEGEVDNIDETNGRVTVMINIFGRSTPVELEYWQIETL